MLTRMLSAMCCASLVTLLGCGTELKPSSPPDPGPTTVTVAAPADEEAKIEAAINELPEEDRALAKAQKFCAVAGEKGRLGSMGKPVKIELDGQPVFLCCDGCEEDARKDAEATLAKVEKLKAANQ